MVRAANGTAALALLAALAGGNARSIGDLCDVLGVSRRAVSRAAGQLAIRGWITREGGGAGIYQATLAGLAALAQGLPIKAGPVGPHAKVNVFSDTLRGRAWLAMRVRRRFTIGEIVTDASRSGEAPAQDRDNIGRYIARLKDAGFVTELSARQQGTAPESNGFKRFMLCRNTGRKPPVYRAAAHLIHDPNTGGDVPCVPR